MKSIIVIRTVRILLLFVFLISGYADAEAQFFKRKKKRKLKAESAQTAVKKTDTLNSDIRFRKSIKTLNSINYPQKVRQIDSLMQIRQYKTVDAEIQTLKQSADKDRKIGYWTKAVLFESQLAFYQKDYTESSRSYWAVLQSNFDTLHDVKSMLIAIEMSRFLKQVFEERKYWFEETIHSDTSADPDKWSSEKLNSEINHLLTHALKVASEYSIGNPDYLEPLLQNHSKYDLFIDLEEIIALKAVEILSGLETETDILYNAPDPLKLISNCEEFIKHDFSSVKDPKNEYRILRLYQLLLKSDNLYFDLQRLKYAETHYGLNEQYKQSIDALYILKKEHPLVNLIAIELAKRYENSEPLKSVEIIDHALSKFPDFKGNSELTTLRQNILRPVLSLDMEKIYKPGNKMLAALTYRNTNTVYYRIYKIKDDTSYFRINYNTVYYDQKYKDSILRFIKKQELVSDWKHLQLPEYKDYLSHSAEFALDGLESGTYVVLSAGSVDPAEINVLINFNTIFVSPYTIFENGERITLYNAIDGSRAGNVGFKLYHKDQQNWNIYNQFSLIHTGRSDNNGDIHIPKAKGWYEHFLIVPDGSSLYYETSRYSHLANNIQKKDESNYKIITDRTIYRPGQKVYFKCIAYKDESKKIIQSEKLKVILKNNNGQEKGKLILTSNKFGSASGTFTLPASGFNTGDFSIQVNDKVYHSIKVEEYKRPKFRAEFTAPDQAYKLNDRVSLKGKAMALAGYPVQNAKVAYTVIRKEKQRYYWGYRSYLPETGNDQTIVSSRTMTDENGVFEISFDAIPDLKRPVSDNPYFIYKLEANITDINGETRTCTYEMCMAYTDREAILSGKPAFGNNKPAELSFRLNNLQGVQLPFTGKITLKQIDTKEEILRKRHWKDCDTTLISPGDYRNYFANYSQRKGSEIYRIVSVRQFENDKSGKVEFGITDIKTAGDYMAVMESVDGNGKPVSSEYRFSVSEISEGIYNATKPLNLHLAEDKFYEPGQKASIVISSALLNANVCIEIFGKTGNVFNKCMRLNRSSQILELQVTEAMRGNLSVQAYLINDYRFYRSNLEIQVPYSNKQLQVKLSTFRSDMEPGSKEKWILSLKGPASEKAAMELATVMYDRSLDELNQENNWQFGIFTDFSHYTDYTHLMGVCHSIYLTSLPYEWSEKFEISYPYLIGLPFNTNYRRYYRSYNNMGFTDMREDGMDVESNKAVLKDEDGIGKKQKSDQGSVRLWDFETANEPKDKPVDGSSGPAIRKNFNETAFFFPHLYADKNGEISIEFEMPDALSEWRMLMLAHSSTMQTGYAEQNVTTSKKVMVQPNLPRFLRQGDRISVSAKIINNSKESLSASVQCIITDELNGNILKWIKGSSVSNLSLKAGSSVQCSFKMEIPDFTGAVSVKFIADAGQFSDAEQHTLPVLSNRTLVTRTLPLSIREAGDHQFTFTALRDNNSISLKHEKLSVEMTANPAWYAVQALPYMMEYPNECAEQIFTRLYANSIAMQLANRNPSVKKVYQSWQRAASSGSSLQSKLMQNQDLKAALLEETPWLMEAQNETARMQMLGKLFDEKKIREELNLAFEKLSDLQLDNGAWPWFKGMSENIHITQTIVIGFGKMKKMGVDISAYNQMIEKAIKFLDKKAEWEYFEWIKTDSNRAVYHSDLQYLYSKSYFPETGKKISEKFLKHYIESAEKKWSVHSLLNQAQLAVALKILKPVSTVPELILRGFNESAQQSKEMGMFWTANEGGWYWYQAPVETQAAIIEMYANLGAESKLIREQQLWLLRQKQTQNWKSTRSTADACYALLAYGNLTDNDRDLSISVAGVKIIPEQKEEGSGYFRHNISKHQINAGSADIKVNAKGSGFSYGAVYWQYFEDNNKIEGAGSGLKIEKKLYRIEHTSKGTQKRELMAGDSVSVGDMIEVVMLLSSDRNLEYVQLKDQRASGTEPVDVLSSYHWKQGLSYYQSTRDASSSFFIDFVPKGSYRISYVIKAEQAGIFDSGIAVAQCMYAPEYAANSNSVILKIK